MSEMIIHYQYVPLATCFGIQTQEINAHKIHGTVTLEMAHWGSSGGQSLPLDAAETGVTIVPNFSPHTRPVEKIFKYLERSFRSQMSMFII